MGDQETVHDFSREDFLAEGSLPEGVAQVLNEFRGVPFGDVLVATFLRHAICHSIQVGEDPDRKEIFANYLCGGGWGGSLRVTELPELSAVVLEVYDCFCDKIHNANGLLNDKDRIMSAVTGYKAPNGESVPLEEPPKRLLRIHFNKPLNIFTTNNRSCLELAQEIMGSAKSSSGTEVR